ncbi:hypothetical protein DFH09DRAFT_1470936 [Mycena vulgaris]|nr:hypothetical protein DFH09DRAFT_1470936 [Mycena vulgaris]
MLQTSHHEFIHVFVCSLALASRVADATTPTVFDAQPLDLLASCYIHALERPRCVPAAGDARALPLVYGAASRGQRRGTSLAAPRAAEADPYRGVLIRPLLRAATQPLLTHYKDHAVVSAGMPAPLGRIFGCMLRMSCGGCGCKIVPRERRTGVRVAGPAYVSCAVRWRRLHGDVLDSLNASSLDELDVLPRRLLRPDAPQDLVFVAIAQTHTQPCVN